jgi:hypothetical protein
MSQQAAAGQGAGAAGRCAATGKAKPRFHFHGNGDGGVKLFKSAVSEITNDTFNTGQNKFAAQFTLSHKNVVNYLQRTFDKGYLVA